MKADWLEILKDEMQKEYFAELMEFIGEEYSSRRVYPPREQIYAALELTGYLDTRVVILGQDPYHGEGQSHGLSFSVANPEAKFPPSLRNIFKELESDTGVKKTCRDLTGWAEQGVLLLNTVLTVRAGEAASHRGRGWESFTDAIIKAVNDRADPAVFLLWGGDAKKKTPLITNGRHKVISSAHPSPLSARNGFFGSRPFSRINALLRDLGKQEIDWSK